MNESTSHWVTFEAGCALARCCAGGALLALGCSSNAPSVTKPTPPDMSAVIAGYAAPSAPLDAQSLSELLAPARELSAEISSLGLDQSVIDAAVQAFNARLDGTRTSSEGVSSIHQSLNSAEGYLQVTRICNGWGAEPTPDSAHNGAIQLTAGFTNDTIDPVVWGTFSACQYAFGGAQVELTGSGDAGSPGLFEAYLGGALPADQIGKKPLIFSVNIDAQVNGVDYLLDRDFSIDATSETVELRISTSEGDLLVDFTASTLVGVRASNGVFSCDETKHACTSADGTQVDF